MVIDSMKPLRESSAATKYSPATRVSWELGFIVEVDFVVVSLAARLQLKASR
jgi:hypothetical protein